jgi:hypothetical protein
MSLARYLSKLGALLNSDGKVPQAALSSNVAGNGPAFRYNASTTQSITNSTFTKVTLASSVFDTTGGMFSSSRFTPTVAGYYQVNAAICMAATGGTTRQILSFFKNGTEHYRALDLYSNTPTSGNFICNGSVLVYLNGSTDYIELYGYFTGSGISFYYAAANETSSMSASLVRAA